MSGASTFAVADQAPIPPSAVRLETSTPRRWSSEPVPPSSRSFSPASSLAMIGDVFIHSLILAPSGSYRGSSTTLAAYRSLKYRISTLVPGSEYSTGR